MAADNSQVISLARRFCFTSVFPMTQKRVNGSKPCAAVAKEKLKFRIFAAHSGPLSETATTKVIIHILRHRGKFVDMHIYIYIYEPDTFRVYITAICCLQYKMESKMDPVDINPL